MRHPQIIVGERGRPRTINRSRTQEMSGEKYEVKTERLCLSVGLLCTAVWQAWCFNSSKTAWLIVPMGLPFALATYAHAFSLNGTRPSWQRIVVLWVGMPLSMLAAALLMAAETGAMYVAGFGVNDLPFLITRFLIGMSAGCLLDRKSTRLNSSHPSIS